MPDIIGMKQVNEKISSSYAKFISTIEKLEGRQ